MKKIGTTALAFTLAIFATAASAANVPAPATQGAPAGATEASSTAIGSIAPVAAVGTVAVAAAVVAVVVGDNNDDDTPATTTTTTTSSTTATAPR